MTIRAEVLRRWDGEILIMNLPVKILAYILDIEIDKKQETDDIEDYRERALQYIQVCNRFDIMTLIDRLTRKHCPNSPDAALLKRALKTKVLQCWTTIKTNLETTQPI